MTYPMAVPPTTLTGSFEHLLREVRAMPPHVAISCKFVISCWSYQAEWVERSCRKIYGIWGIEPTFRIKKWLLLRRHITVSVKHVRADDFVSASVPLKKILDEV